jgi:hypothetical protein
MHEGADLEGMGVVARQRGQQAGHQPGGTSLLYLAPDDSTGHFQLWWLDNATAATPAPPKLVTSHLDFDATSAPAWAA